MTPPIHDAVATHAYHAWEAEGRPHGRHEHHWFSAEAALTRIAEPAAVGLVQTASAVKAAEAPVAKKTASRKAAQPKAVAPKTSVAKAAPKAAAPKVTPAERAPAEAVVAAAALATPLAVRDGAKTARRTH